MPVTPVTILTRNDEKAPPNERGKLLLNGAPVVLRGGGYDVFFDPGESPEAIGKPPRPGRFKAHVVDEFAAPGTPRQTQRDKTEDVVQEGWIEGRNEFTAFFAAMRSTRCNFVRVFLTGGTMVRGGKPVTHSPFVRTNVAGGVRYDVRGAVESGKWNEAFFTRLTAFVRQADAAGVVVQLSLFNYYDLVPDPVDSAVKTWSFSPWNVRNSLDAAWAAGHLIPHATGSGARQREFVTPPSGRRTRLVQQKLIGRVMQAVAGYRNVVLEVMNEPHQVTRPADPARVAEFDSFVTRTIVGHRPVTGSQAMISVNASFVLPEVGDPPGDSDVDVWAGRRDLAGYDDVDMVSYHGLTAMGVKDLGGVHAPRVDAAAVDARADLHGAFHSAKALLFSTDAVLVRQFEHTYASGASMNVRDGQIRPVPGGTTLEAQLLRSRVYHWARRCFDRGRGAELGRLHFHNHTTFRMQLQQISVAARDAGVQPAATAALEEEEIGAV